MGPLPTKRRKLDHNAATRALGIPEKDKDDSNITEESPSDDEAQVTQSKPARAPLKRRQDDHDEALYTGGLYKSNMFKLQVDEMLREVRPNYEKRLGGVDDSLRRLKIAIEGIEDRGALSVSFPIVRYTEVPLLFMSYVSNRSPKPRKYSINHTKLPFLFQIPNPTATLPINCSTQNHQA